LVCARRGCHRHIDLLMKSLRRHGAGETDFKTGRKF
jgi:hypothetical protein